MTAISSERAHIADVLGPDLVEYYTAVFRRLLDLGAEPAAAHLSSLDVLNLALQILSEDLTKLRSDAAKIGMDEKNRIAESAVEGAISTCLAESSFKKDLST